MKTTPIYALLILVSGLYALGIKRVDLPSSVSDPAHEVRLDETFVSELPTDWVFEAELGASHFTQLGDMSGSSSMLHLAFDLSLVEVNSSVEGACSYVDSLKMAFSGEQTRNLTAYEATYHPLLSVFRLLEAECEDFRTLVVHTKNSFINRFGMDVEEAIKIDNELEVLHRSSQVTTRRPKRQIAAAVLIGMGIWAIGSYLFSSHQMAQISFSAGVDHTTVK